MLGSFITETALFLCQFTGGVPYEVFVALRMGKTAPQHCPGVQGGTG